MKFTGLRLFCLAWFSCSCSGNLFAPGMRFHGIQISPTDFTIDSRFAPAVGSIPSRVECAVQFWVATKSSGSVFNDVNGFHYDQAQDLCRIGTVTFPVQELDEGGILVSGISKKMA